ncbi:Protein phosphatase-1 regulatory subunit 7 alpha2 [Cryptosporidium tyzzeri]|nr:Protein phosphatase-1 regulatory subunit 7 alpha2 [Cryptosporidium tyzzeri]
MNSEKEIKQDNSQNVVKDSESEEPIKSLRIGIDYPVYDDDEEINIQCGRIAEIENLSKCKELRSLMLISNHIRKIKNLDELIKLKTLELYQNKIKKIENLEKLVNLEVLDLSFNRIKKLENLENQNKLKKLFLTNNKIKIIQGLNNNKELKLLELGSNDIRIIENIDHLSELEELWLGKNKITTLDDIPLFQNIKIISLQSNRIVNWSINFSKNVNNVQELYLSDNQLISPDKVYFDSFQNLKVLDLGGNKIQNLEAISKIESLEELWINDNDICDINQLILLKNLRNLQTLYLERNPIQNQLGPAYRLTVIKIVPWITQLDAIPINRSGEIHFIQS